MHGLKAIIMSTRAVAAAGGGRSKANKIVMTLLFFFLAGLHEIGGAYLVWLWLLEKKTIALGAVGGISLFVYLIVPTFQQARFRRAYASYGGILTVSSII